MDKVERRVLSRCRTGEHDKCPRRIDPTGENLQGLPGDYPAHQQCTCWCHGEGTTDALHADEVELEVDPAHKRREAQVAARDAELWREG